MSLDEQSRPVIKLGDPAVRYLCSELYQKLNSQGNYEVRRKSDDVIVDIVIIKVKDIEIRQP